MKTLAAMLGIGKSFWVLFLIPHLGIWNIDGETCNAQIHIKRDTMYNALAGKSFQLDCPVDKCANTHNVTWCKIEGEKCPLLGETHHRKMKQNEKKDILVYSLYFDQALASDNGSYRCSANVSSGLLESYSITLYVTGEQKKPSDTAERRISLVDVPQPCGSEQTKKSTRQNSQNLPLETEVYDNDPWCGVQEEPGVYSIQCLEENRQGVVYASLNHSVIEMNQRQARNMKEAPTEYAAICVRS
ncbi:B- and T-lymphocyte attenuator [Pteronotus mesoamericanus]|uniref:B- and T-lymphocyte attenuator n=1 Tax=Pteronotus mesoamericanus TaxID=1884717 RepID=UPI0023EC28C4|nr:B- and T-lymphocyte attenuator [Pteronotus parnellii mesoamericanus]